MTFRRRLSHILPQGIKNKYHLAQAILACVYFGFPGRKLAVIGVTGTNGKTTTSEFIAQILEYAGKKTALASTIRFQIGEKKWENASKFTTLSPWRLQAFLREAVDARCEYAVIETSSHALDQNRIWGVRYAIAVLTNVTREHLDYHKTMEEYRRTKRKLFVKAQQGVINRDMEDPRYFRVEEKTAIFYSTKDPQAHIFAEKIEVDFKGSEFVVDGTVFRLNVPGFFNIENALAALSTARLLSVDFSAAQRALAAIAGVPGRMELVPNGFGADILIDYAVTPDAFEKLYASILPLKIPGTKIIHVFGSCGERDRGKRPILGEIVSGYADIAILTDEDPYHEDPIQILDDIEVGLKKTAGESYFRIPDRREAIRKALSLAEIGDIVLITGKGAEKTMALGDERMPWDEREVVAEEIRRRG